MAARNDRHATGQRFLHGQTPGFTRPATRQDKEVGHLVDARHGTLVFGRVKLHAGVLGGFGAEGRFEGPGANEEKGGFFGIELQKRLKQTKGVFFCLKFSSKKNDPVVGWNAKGVAPRVCSFLIRVVGLKAGLVNGVRA